MHPSKLDGIRRPVLAVAIVAPLVALSLAMVQILNLTADRIVANQAERTAFAWANYIGAELDQIGTLAAGRGLGAEERAFLGGARQFGDVFRFKLFSADGRLRLVSDELLEEEVAAGSLGDHNSKAASVLATGKPHTQLESGAGKPDRPDVYAESYVPVRLGGKTVAIVEVYVDQTEQAALLKTDFLHFGLEIAGVTLLALCVPFVLIGMQARRMSRQNAVLEVERNKALAAERTKSRFLANMSHEIRTPMNGILGMLSLLPDTKLNEEQSKLVRTAQQSARGLLVIINDILDLSKLDDGKLDLEEHSFCISRLIDEVVSVSASGILDKNVRIDVALDPDLPEWLCCDSGRLRQILFNLVGNAVKFTEKGSVTVQVSHEMLEGGALELRCEVRDTGIGIPVEAHDRLFARFTQADGGTARKYGGTGLGLAISKQLTEVMGGAIGFKSKPGKGSVFWFTVRCRIGEPVCAAEAIPVQTETREGLRILVAEDNHVNQLFVTKVLEKMGHSVEIAGNGTEAVEAVSERPFDLVLMDVHMPEMDGIEATRAIRRLPGDAAGIPIVALTANAMTGHREEYLVAGMNDYVSKPIEPHELQAAIARSRSGAAARPAVRKGGAGADPAPGGDSAAPDGAEPPLMDSEKLTDLRETLDREELRDLMVTVPDECGNLMNQIREALVAGDLDAARTVAHCMRGMACNFAANRIAAIAGEIEWDVKSVEEAEERAGRLEAAIVSTRQWIESAA